MGTEFFFFYMVELARLMVDSLFLWKWQMNQILTERCDLLNSIWNNSSGQDFLEFNYFVQMDRLQLTAVYCNRRVV